MLCYFCIQHTLSFSVTTITTTTLRRHTTLYPLIVRYSRNRMNMKHLQMNGPQPIAGIHWIRDLFRLSFFSFPHSVSRCDHFFDACLPFSVWPNCMHRTRVCFFFKTHSLVGNATGRSSTIQRHVCYFAISPTIIFWLCVDIFYSY